MKILTTEYENNCAAQTERELRFVPDNNQELCVLNIYPEERFQEIEGFGGAVTDAAGYVYSALSEKSRTELISAYFGSSGAGYTLGRCPVDSCDFSLETYCADGDPEDEALRQFSLSRAGLYAFPLLRDICAAQKDFAVMLSPWSPPEYMKSNGSRLRGGTLLEKYRKRWAEYLCRYIEQYRAQGFSVFALSVQNEPNAVQTWDSCQYTAQQELEFIRDFLAPALKAHSLTDIRLTVWDHNKERLFDRVDAICSDSCANAAVSAAGFHWYSGDHFEALELVRRKYPDKKLYFTEGCIEYSRFSSGAQLENARHYAREISRGICAGLNAFLDWNLLLDSEGGPNHKGNLCDAPLMADENGRLRYNLSYYYISHYSRHIHPGAVRLGTTRFCDGVEFCAARNPNGSIASVIMNSASEKKEYFVRCAGKMCAVEMPANSISTLIIEKDELYERQDNPTA